MVLSFYSVCEFYFFNYIKSKGWKLTYESWDRVAQWLLTDLKLIKSFLSVVLTDASAGCSAHFIVGGQNQSCTMVGFVGFCDAEKGYMSAEYWFQFINV